MAYADDKTLVCDAIDQMQTQITKIVLFCAWSGMTLATHKCNLTGILHIAVPNAAKKPMDWALIEPLLAGVTINGSPVRHVPPDVPFKYLGVLITLPMTRNWTHQFEAVKALSHERSQLLIRCPLLYQQKVIAEESSLLSFLRHCFCLAPFTPRQLQVRDLEDAVRARFYKALLSLLAGTSTDLMYLPNDHHGLGSQSLVPIYVQTAAETLVDCLSDKGALGDVIRALLDCHLRGLSATQQRSSPSMANPGLEYWGGEGLSNTGAGSHVPQKGSLDPQVWSYPRFTRLSVTWP